MYHDKNTHIIEGDDILSVEQAVLHTDSEGIKHLTLIVVLRPESCVDSPEYLHVTNGVEHRLLTIPPRVITDDETGGRSVASHKKEESTPTKKGHTAAPTPHTAEEKRGG